MANLKSSKKDAKRSKVRAKRNAARSSAIKTATKKVLAAITAGEPAQARELFRAAESKIDRARGRGVLKKRTAARKVSRLAKRVAAASAC